MQSPEIILSHDLDSHLPGPRWPTFLPPHDVRPGDLATGHHGQLELVADHQILPGDDHGAVPADHPGLRFFFLQRTAFLHADVDGDFERNAVASPFPGIVH